MNTGDPLCGAFEACGGDPVGSWVFDSMCFDELPQIDLEEAACQKAVTGVFATLEGTLDIEAGGTFSSNGSGTFGMDLSVSDACVREIAGSGVNVTPAALDAFCDGMHEAYSEPEASSSILTGSCIRGAGSCDCEVDSNTSDFAGRSGQWTTDGTAYTLGGDVGEYCVDGDTLTLWEELEGGDGGGAQTILRRAP